MTTNLDVKSTVQVKKQFADKDAALLLSEYLKVKNNVKTRKNAIEFISVVMRQKATAMGVSIDDSYRSVAGITSQMSTMESAYKGIESVPTIFKEIVDLYKNDKEAYDVLLEETYEYFGIDNQELSNVWLLTWNPNNWNWIDYENAIIKTESGEIYNIEWGCRSRKPKIGDSVYLMVLGCGGLNGIIAYGRVAQESFLADHWDEKKKSEGVQIDKIRVDFEKILNYKEISLKQKELQLDFPNQKWNPQGTGISIKQEIAKPLFYKWNALVGGDNMENNVAYSWELIGEKIAIKTCDRSFFDNRGSAVPKEFSCFFGSDSIQAGNNRELTYIYKGIKYNGRVNLDSLDRTRIFWKTDLANAFNEYRDTANVKAQFTKLSNGYYKIEFIVDGILVPFDIREYIFNVQKYIASKGYIYEETLIKNFYLSLKSKPFVILAGISGTGKTKLVELFAEAIGAEYKLVPVRPDWSDASDLFGHVDLKGRFIPGAIFSTLVEAKNNPDVPYFLCLDEMNLARVEYYFSDFLSVMETRKRINGEIITVPLITNDYYGPDDEARENYGEIILPQNLYIVGTVNMDDTTFAFSKKVLDRANTIEFNEVNLEWPESFDTEIETSQKLFLDNAFLQTEYLQLAECKNKADVAKDICAKLQEINGMLRNTEEHVGYRVRDEIAFYMCNNSLEDGELLAANEAFDLELMQKILPRINGSSNAIQQLLIALFKYCTDNEVGNADDMLEVLKNDCKYKHSAEKVQLMLRRFEDDGFTSYWL